MRLASALARASIGFGAWADGTASLEFRNAEARSVPEATGAGEDRARFGEVDMDALSGVKEGEPPAPQ